MSWLGCVLLREVRSHEWRRTRGAGEVVVIIGRSLQDRTVRDRGTARRTGGHVDRWRGERGPRGLETVHATGFCCLLLSEARQTVYLRG